MEPDRRAEGTVLRVAVQKLEKAGGKGRHGIHYGLSKHLRTMGIKVTQAAGHAGVERNLQPNVSASLGIALYLGRLLEKNTSQGASC